MVKHRAILQSLWDQDDLAGAIRGEIEKGLPGRDQQYLMAPATRAVVDVPDAPIHSAVLLLIYPRSEPHLVLMKRTHDGRIHSGQISLPGGRMEPSDRNLEETAIRETIEETGARLDKLAIAGSLTPLHIPVSNFLVHPFVGISGEPPDFWPDSREVEQLIEFPLYELFEERALKHKHEELFGKWVKIPYYDIKGFEVWGATAMVLCEFIELWRRLAALHGE